MLSNEEINMSTLGVNLKNGVHFTVIDDDSAHKLRNQARSFNSLAESLKVWIIKRELWQEEYSDELFEILQGFGLFSRVRYDPKIHGEIDDADPGDEIWWTSK